MGSGMIRLSFLLLFHAAVARPPRSNDENGLLGHSLYLPETDMMTEIPLEGLYNSDYIPESCIRESNRDTSTKETIYFRSTKEVYTTLARTTAVDEELAADQVLKASLDAVAGDISAKTTESLTGYSIEMTAERLSRGISADCLSDFSFSSGFMNDFQSLPRVYSNNNRYVFFEKYLRFLKTRGTHFIKSVTFGASVRHYSFGKASQSFSQNDFRIKSCIKLAELAKTTVDELDIKDCRGVTAEDTARVNKMAISSRVVIRGGTLDSRINLLFTPTDDKIRTFLDAGYWEVVPISYTMVEIWELLKIKFFGTPNYARAKNLEDYFKGVLMFECSQIVINGYIMQRYVRSTWSSDDRPSYECQLRSQGCMDDGDCHYRVVPAECSCHGPSCIEHKREARTDGSVKVVPYAWRSERATRWGCRGGNPLPTTCGCEYPAQFTKVWPKE
ncbi:DELTA-alicitoxin-Pse2b [Nematostella vectensis]|uniref:DELTA-alicitoxin-Pse2b n=1 Tax=Nematostella vectensis TaxID=45351 RepID=UPI0020779992|nr:DELTA-alicitoxin-Pse2b [Nematostella vectensis]